MLYKKLKDLGLIEIDQNYNIKITNLEKFQDYFKKIYNEKM